MAGRSMSESVPSQPPGPEELLERDSKQAEAKRLIKGAALGVALGAILAGVARRHSALRP